VTASAAAAAPSSRGGPSSDVVLIARGAQMATVHERMVKALGPRRAGEILRETLDRFGERMLETPQDMLDFAELLIKSGGLVQAVGRSLKVQALLRGAVER
jgi:hypothetical protein